MKKKNLFLLFFVIFLFFANYASAQSDLPIGLQKIIDYNSQYTSDFVVKISFFVAFVAGILTIFSPCILPFLPAYFSYTFKEKKNITKMTLIFFFGFSLIFVTMGVIAGFLGEQSLAVLQNVWLVTLAGIFLIIMGILALVGKGFSSFIKFNHRFKNDVPGTFFFGISFALGWTACLGPVLAGILGIGAILHNLWYSALLLFFYSLGNMVPLFVLSVFYDKLTFLQNPIIKGKVITFNFLGKNFYTHTTNILSGLIFIILGALIIIFKGTGFVNKLDIFGTKKYFYSLQNQLLNWQYANQLGIVLLILFITSIAWLILRDKKNGVKL
ncbi:cytochrome c biogenesis protein CcdA [Candidatus Woesearchaeota archaeon]|nr:cytochrome c biogenesis protein CcdA [Candidatus Woesearchaeota archaeon]